MLMSEPDGTQASALQRPTNDDRKEAWKAYWKTQNQPWRTEPEISPQRQEELKQHRTIVPDIDRGIYPFGGMKLSRADIEWLLATHENGRGPVDWNDERQRRRDGLDLRAAHLDLVDLSNLPLARLHGGLAWQVHGELSWRGWFLSTKQQGDMAAVHLEGTNLRGAHLEGADLREAHLERTDLRWVHMEEIDLRGAHLEGADLRGAYLEGALLIEAALSDEKNIGPLLADVRWGNSNLAVVNWSQVQMLGDEYTIWQKKHDGKVTDTWYAIALRANRQLSLTLQTQGMYEDASRFSYRAQRLQRVVLRRQSKFGQYLFSLVLDLLAGYGYRPGRSVIWYLVIIFGFALAYYAFGHLSLFPPDALIYSLTSFHGRGFFPGLEHKTSLHDPLVILAAVEAVVGLLIEISFIATFTQRFFGK